MKNKTNLHKIEFSKKCLIIDYIVTFFLILFFIYTLKQNSDFVIDTTNQMLENGMEITINPPYDINTIQIVIVAWISQFAISSYAYYWKSKAENLVKLPIYLLDNIPKDMKDKIDPNQIVQSSLSIGTN